MSIFHTLLMISGFCLGFREVTDDIENGSRIGYPLRQWFTNHIPLWIAKPVILCCTCMASFWGTIIYWLVWVHFNAGKLQEGLQDWETYTLWIFCCVTASFTNTVLWNLRNRIIGL